MDEPSFVVENPVWWPLDLSEAAMIASLCFYKKIRSSRCNLDFERLKRATSQLDLAMKGHVARVIERDNLPSLAHVLNGWGNFTFKGKSGAELISAFIHRDGCSRPIILQCDAEGDFHPWQSFAYAVMAGISVDRPITANGPSIRELATNSRCLNTTEGRELGHLLFALSHIDPTVAGPGFSLGGELFSVPDLMKKAVTAHRYGGFEVCRKFHLTEGLCAAAVRMPGLETFCTVAQHFLRGQMDMLFVLGAILASIKDLSSVIQPQGFQNPLEDLRDGLVVGRFIENHFYHAGHLIELAAFAHIDGYEISSEQWNAIRYIINELNFYLPFFLQAVQFSEVFLHFGHYRRAITLIGEIEIAREQGREVDGQDVARYAADFDSSCASSQLRAPFEHSDCDIGRFFDIGRSELSSTRAHFKQIIDRYASLARSEFMPRGDFSHFRRMGPISWPRALHYELLDYGDMVGVEIHLESRSVEPFQKEIRALRDRVAGAFAGRPVEWDPNWWKCCGRLRILFDDCAPTETVADAMCALIDLSWKDLDVCVHEF